MKIFNSKTEKFFGLVLSSLFLASCGDNPSESVESFVQDGSEEANLAEKCANGLTSDCLRGSWSYGDGTLTFKEGNRFEFIFSTDDKSDDYKYDNWKPTYCPGTYTIVNEKQIRLELDNTQAIGFCFNLETVITIGATVNETTLILTGINGMTYFYADEPLIKSFTRLPGALPYLTESKTLHLTLTEYEEYERYDTLRYANPVISFIVYFLDFKEDTLSRGAESFLYLDNKDYWSGAVTKDYTAPANTYYIEICADVIDYNPNSFYYDFTNLDYESFYHSYCVDNPYRCKGWGYECQRQSFVGSIMSLKDLKIKRYYGYNSRLGLYWEWYLD